MLRLRMLRRFFCLASMVLFAGLSLSTVAQPSKHELELRPELSFSFILVDVEDGGAVKTTFEEMVR